MAAFTAVYLAPHHKIFLGMSMAPLATFLTVALNLIYESLGNRVDFPGMRGGLILICITLIFNGGLCALGTVLGYSLSRKSA